MLGDYRVPTLFSDDSDALDVFINIVFVKNVFYEIVLCKCLFVKEAVTSACLYPPKCGEWNREFVKIFYGSIILEDTVPPTHTNFTSFD